MSALVWTLVDALQPQVAQPLLLPWPSFNDDFYVGVAVAHPLDVLDELFASLQS